MSFLIMIKLYEMYRIQIFVDFPLDRERILSLGVIFTGPNMS